MDKIKSAKSVNFKLDSKEAVLVLIANIAVVIQPILDIISSVIINSGSESPISFSGAVRAIMAVLILVFSCFAYNGKYKKLFSGYLTVSAVYMLVVSVMTAVNGSLSAVFYMFGLLVDTFFFQFVFVFLVEVFFTARKRVHPAVIALVTVIYAVTIGLNYIFKEKIAFKFLTAFAAVLAILLPFALVYCASRFAKARKGDSVGDFLSVLLPILGLALVLFGYFFSKSKQVLFSSVIFAVVFFIWAFSNWRNTASKMRKKPLLKGWIASVLFFAIVLALFPFAPVKKEFDGTFKLKEIFYTYQGVDTNQTDANGNPVIPMFDDEDTDEDEDNDYVPHLDSGYKPGQDKDEDDEKEESSSNKVTQAPTTEIAGDELTSEEATTEEVTTDNPYITDKNGEVITIPGGRPIPKPTRPSQSDMDKWESQFSDIIASLPIPTKPKPSKPSTEPTNEEDLSKETEHKAPEADNKDKKLKQEEKDQYKTPVGAIGVGALRTPYPVSSQFAAINIDRTKFYSDIMFSSKIQTVLFGLRYASLFDDTLTPAAKVHSDPISVFLNYGVLGLIIYILPLLFIAFSILKFIFTHLGVPSTSITYVASLFSAFLILFMSVLDGNILASSIVSSMAAVVIANTFTMGEEASANAKK